MVLPHGSDLSPHRTGLHGQRIAPPPSKEDMQTLVISGEIGSWSLLTSFCIRRSRIKKFVAHVSSSKSSPVAPAWMASEILAAMDVDPLASELWNGHVERPWGRLAMNVEMSVPWTARLPELQGRVHRCSTHRCGE